MAKGGGGAWKVAYADFVTAMMAFFLVMWICGQDQKVKRAVSHYFVDPFNTSKTGSKKPSRMGSITENASTGSVPQAESVAMGQGRNSYTGQGESSIATKMVSDWLHTDKTASEYWREQAQRQREAARKLTGVGTKHGAADTSGVQQLSRQLRDELTRGIHQQPNGLHQDLLHEMISRVSWIQIAEDLLSH